MRYAYLLFVDFGVTSTNCDLELPVEQKAAYEKWQSTLQTSIM